MAKRMNQKYKGISKKLQKTAKNVALLLFVSGRKNSAESTPFCEKIKAEKFQKL